MKADSDPAEYERRALLMRHSPELLNELRACYEILLRVLDHQRDGVPLPPQLATRRTCRPICRPRRLLLWEAFPHRDGWTALGDT
jgi:hypothetical protein